MRIIILLVFISNPVIALDLALPEDKAVHPWEQKAQEKPKVIRLSDENYLSNGQERTGGLRFNSDGRSSLSFPGSKVGMTVPVMF